MDLLPGAAGCGVASTTAPPGVTSEAATGAGNPRRPARQQGPAAGGEAAPHSTRTADLWPRTRRQAPARMSRSRSRRHLTRRPRPGRAACQSHAAAMSISERRGESQRAGPPAAAAAAAAIVAVRVRPAAARMKRVLAADGVQHRVRRRWAAAAWAAAAGRLLASPWQSGSEPTTRSCARGRPQQPSRCLPTPRQACPAEPVVVRAAVDPVWQARSSSSIRQPSSGGAGRRQGRSSSGSGGGRPASRSRVEASGWRRSSRSCSPGGGREAPTARKAATWVGGAVEMWLPLPALCGGVPLLNQHACWDCPGHDVALLVPPTMLVLLLLFPCCCRFTAPLPLPLCMAADEESASTGSSSSEGEEKEERSGPHHRRAKQQPAPQQQQQRQPPEQQQQQPHPPLPAPPPVTTQQSKPPPAAKQQTAGQPAETGRGKKGAAAAGGGGGTAGKQQQQHAPVQVQERPKPRPAQPRPAPTPLEECDLFAGPGASLCCWWGRSVRDSLPAGARAGQAQWDAALPACGAACCAAAQPAAHQRHTPCLPCSSEAIAVGLGRSLSGCEPAGGCSCSSRFRPATAEDDERDVRQECCGGGGCGGGSSGSASRRGSQQRQGPADASSSSGREAGGRGRWDSCGRRTWGRRSAAGGCSAHGCQAGAWSTASPHPSSCYR